MATISEDMLDYSEETLIFQETTDLLRERQARIERGESRLLGWDKVNVLGTVY
jgi:hypothetical protein